MESLAIIIAATGSFQYCLRVQSRAIARNAELAGVVAGHLILVTDEKPLSGILDQYAIDLPDGWMIHHLALPVVEPAKKDYSKNAQLLIAQLYTAGFDRARALGVSHVWTLESDVIPEPNNLRCMRDMLAFDAGYYDVAFCPYVAAGGGGIMGGRGTANNWILPNWWEDELEMPEDLINRIKEHREKSGAAPSKEWIESMQALETEAKKYPPKGNVFKLNSEGWRRRGWLDHAYPGIGKGAILPSDWMPMGNNLFSHKAITFVDFMGYSGSGTQDLYIGYLRLAANGLRFCAIPHSLSHHIVRKENADGGPFTMYYLHHEQEGECVGHLRQKEIPFFSHESGERIAADASYSI